MPLPMRRAHIYLSAYNGCPPPLVGLVPSVEWRILAEYHAQLLGDEYGDSHIRNDQEYGQLVGDQKPYLAQPSGHL